jgi:hypothetical protein
MQHGTLFSHQKHDDDHAFSKILLIQEWGCHDIGCLPLPFHVPAAGGFLK